jgi:hypothetical protein
MTEKLHCQKKRALELLQRLSLLHFMSTLFSKFYSASPARRIQVLSSVGIEVIEQLYEYVQVMS